MTVAPNPPLAGATPLLPTRAAVLGHLTELLPGTRQRAATLVLVGLSCGDDDATALAKVTPLLAGLLRADDWMGSWSPGELAVVMSGAATGAQSAAERLVAAVAGLGVPGLSAAAGIAALSTDLDATEAIRRGAVSLRAARRVGPGAVVQHRPPY